jgi:hypothetical protein
VGNLAWTVGNVRITRIVEHEVPVELTGLLPDATPDALERHRSWLAPHFLNVDGRATLSIHGLVVESAGQRILVDTCVGDRTVAGYEEFSRGARPFLRDLEAAGFPPASIDVVLCTHMHFDHVGWNTIRVDGRWVPTSSPAPSGSIGAARGEEASPRPSTRPCGRSSTQDGPISSSRITGSTGSFASSRPRATRPATSPSPSSRRACTHSSPET